MSTTISRPCSKSWSQRGAGRAGAGGSRPRRQLGGAPRRRCPSSADHRLLLGRTHYLAVCRVCATRSLKRRWPGYGKLVGEKSLNSPEAPGRYRRRSQRPGCLVWPRRGRRQHSAGHRRDYASGAAGSQRHGGNRGLSRSRSCAFNADYRASYRRRVSQRWLAADARLVLLSVWR